MRLVSRNGKWSAECYLYRSDTGERERTLRATGVLDDGSASAKKTAAEIGRRIEADINGAHGTARARASRRTSAITLYAAYPARIKALQALGRSAATCQITADRSVHPLRYFGHDRDLDREPLTDACLIEYAARALVTRKPASVLRELLELRCGLKALNKTLPKDMQINVPAMPPLPARRAVEIWLTSEQRGALHDHLPARWREHFVIYCMLGLSRGELYKITREDVFAREVRVRGSKREKRDRVLPMSAPVHAILSRRAREVAPGLPLFEHWDQSARALTAAAKRAGIVPQGWREGANTSKPKGRAGWSVNVNVLRASFATELVLAGVHNKKIAELMGHTSTAMVDRWYTRLRSSDLEDAIVLVRDPRTCTT